MNEKAITYYLNCQHPPYTHHHEIRHHRMATVQSNIFSLHYSSKKCDFIQFQLQYTYYHSSQQIIHNPSPLSNTSHHSSQNRVYQLPPSYVETQITSHPHEILMIL
jgi:hypothetical protein